MAMARALFPSQYLCVNKTNNTAQIRSKRSIQVSCISSNQEDLLSRRQTSYNHADEFGLQVKVEEKKVSSFNGNEHIFDEGVFEVSNINAFGQSFRDYNAESERQKSVEEFYRVQHINQTYDYVTKMRKEYGKVLLHQSFGELPQWAVVGDTFPLGCAFDESIVHHKYFKENPDINNIIYNTKNGVYEQGCGLNKVVMSWGHDDYMYLVAKENGTTLPYAALFVIRYHSFYALHKSGAYTHLMNEEDKENIKWLNIFNKYDLYSKSNVRIDVEKVKPYYLSLIQKYFPKTLRW
ncbi:hypothetical protein H5410_049396 [Solanum commersonii]|uniref:Inositol oxygenase n=1 Tax=Solanum commersonii TaxID=4109 RepID=A0A9J5WSG0_SOLCO|nr:hypothetical protein H5410_049396 [Solanum commersonii]